MTNRAVFVLGVVCLTFAVSPLEASQPVEGVTNFGTGPMVTYVTGAADGAGIVAPDVFGYSMRLRLATATSASIFLEDVAWGTGNGIDYFGSGQGQPAIPLVSFDISSNNGFMFDLQSLNYSITDFTGGATTEDVTLTGYVDGIAVPGASVTQTTQIITGTFPSFDVSANPAFVGITSFSITPAAGSEIGYLSFDNLNATNFRAAVVPEPSTYALLYLGLAGWAGFALRRCVARL